MPATRCFDRGLAIFVLLVPFCSSSKDTESRASDWLALRRESTHESSIDLERCHSRKMFKRKTKEEITVSSSMRVSSLHARRIGFQPSEKGIDILFLHRGIGPGNPSLTTTPAIRCPRFWITGINACLFNGTKLSEYNRPLIGTGRNRNRFIVIMPRRLSGSCCGN